MGVFVRGRKLYIRFKAPDGKWRNAPSGYNVGQEAEAQALYLAVRARVAGMEPEVVLPTHGETFRPSWCPRPRVKLPSPLDGWVYAVALIPEISLNRIKVGWTEFPIESRLATYRTSSPYAFPLAVWPAHFGAEAVAHRALSGRLLNSEVFVVQDVRAAITAIDRAIASYTEAMRG